MGLTFTHHRDFVDGGYNPLAGPLGGGNDKYGVKCAFQWDPDKLDGAPVYTYEFTVDNPSAGAGRCALARLDSWFSVTELAGSSISIPAGTPATTYRVGPVTIPAGAFYGGGTGSLIVPVVENPGTVIGAGMTLTMGRLKILQTNATKTRIWRPLINDQEGEGSCYYCQTDLLLGAVGIPAFPNNSGLCERKDSQYAAASRSYQINTNIGVSGSGILTTTLRFGLWNTGRAAEVAASAILTQPQGFFSSPQFNWVFLNWTTDPNFVDLEFLQWYWKQMEPVLLGTAKLYAADLYIDLEGISKVTTWYRVSKGTGTSTGGFASTQYTARILSADFAGASEMFTEASGYMDSGGVTGRNELLDAGASDTAQSGSAIPGTEAILSGTVRNIARSATFLPSVFPANSRVICQSTLESGSGDDEHADWFLIAAVFQSSSTGITCPPGATITPVCKTGTILAICKDGTIVCCPEEES
jgi:hypothetical protein